MSKAAIPGIVAEINERMDALDNQIAIYREQEATLQREYNEKLEEIRALIEDTYQIRNNFGVTASVLSDMRSASDR